MIYFHKYKYTTPLPSSPPNILSFQAFSPSPNSSLNFHFISTLSLVYTTISSTKASTMQRSYSKKAFPWDNACIESFHSIIKREWLNRFKIRDYKQAYRLIFEYLEAFYNTKRIHSHCDFMSPNEFERVYERTHTKAELLAG